MQIAIPTHVSEMISLLQSAGHSAFVVGGCLRDLLLHLEPKDWDLTTDAPVDALPDLLPGYRIIPTGLRFGTVTVLHPLGPLELSTFRADTLAGDLGRRDFTINAMAWSASQGLIDPWQGQADICAQVLRLTGGEERLLEDPLRMLRAVRFAATLDFTLHGHTQAAITAHSQLINQVSAERIGAELNRILLSPRPAQGLELLRETGLLRHILPEVAAGHGFSQHHPAHNQDVYNHTLLTVAKTPADLIVRWAALLHDVAKPLTFSQDEAGVGHFYGHEKLGAQLAGQMLRRLRIDNQTITRVKDLIRNHMQAMNYPQKRPGKLLAQISPDNISALFALQRADIQATAAGHDLAPIDEMEAKVKDYLAQEQPIARRDLAISGADLLALGIPQGPEVGELLARLTEAVLASPELNERKQLLTLARRLMS